MLTLRMAAALKVLTETDGRSGLAEVMASLGVSRSRAGQLIQQLEQRGLVRRPHRYARRLLVKSSWRPEMPSTPEDAWTRFDDEERREIGIAAIELLLAGELPASPASERIEDVVAVAAPSLLRRSPDV